MEMSRSPCWECQSITDDPIVVTLQMADKEVGRFSLCPACYRAYCLPLAADGSRTLVITRDAASGRHLP
jgi:hypothetical protein